MYLGVRLCCVVSKYSYRLWLCREPRDRFWYIPFSAYSFSFFRFCFPTRRLFQSHVVRAYPRSRPSLQLLRLANCLPEGVLGSRADSLDWNKWPIFKIVPFFEYCLFFSTHFMHSTAAPRMPFAILMFDPNWPFYKGYSPLMVTPLATFHNRPFF